MDNKQQSEQDIAGHRKARAAEIADSIEWVVTALILAFVFRAFVMEAFRIPTGSMADTLMGAHFRLCCTQCGYKYEYGFIPEQYNLPADSMPRGFVRSSATRCPNCGFLQTSGKDTTVSYGDRILVLKCIYEYVGPKRWDVIVFRNPLDPQINFIKRLVALPGETIEIIDGDVYIDGQISRKPSKVQEELWMPIYDNDYQPARPKEPFFNGRHIWRQPFDVTGSNWKAEESNLTKFRLESSPEQINTMSYDTSVGNDFRATYAYDEINSYRNMPYCSDLKVRYWATFGEEKGLAGILLSKYQTLYKASIDKDGRMFIAKSAGQNEFTELAAKTIKPIESVPVEVSFANVDHQLIFQVGNEKLMFDLGRKVGDAGPIIKNIEPQVKIFGSGNLKLSHVAVMRDIHYTNVDGPGVGRAVEGRPFKLQKDEFFVLGDNSPNSADGRWWPGPGKGNSGATYRAGVVPRDYLVGKALFVYWPSGFKPYAACPVPLIPNVGRMRVIYGGK